MSKIIGFIGSDKVELILWYARMLKHLGQKVVLQDLSETMALTYCICKEEKNIKSYLGIDFDESEVLCRKKKYDVVLVDFGFNFDEETISKCEEIWIYTDIQCHNVMKLKELELEKNQKRILIIKDVVKGKINSKYICRELQHLNIGRDPYVLYWEQEDHRLAIQCQYNNCSHFTKISEEYYELFLEQLEEQGFEKGSIKKAFKKGGRGKHGFHIF